MTELLARLAGNGVEIHGPFLPEHYVTNNSYRVPNVTVRPRTDGTFDVIVDRRFGMFRSVTAEELDCWIPLLANAMAVAAGYSCHGEHSQKINPFAVRMSSLGPTAPTLSLVETAGGGE